MKRNVLIIFMVYASIGLAQADLSSGTTLDAARIFRDATDPNIFYYAPTEIVLKTDTDGKPRFSFTRITHVPSRAGDKEDWQQSSIIQFVVGPKFLPTYQKVKSSIQNRICPSCNIQLRPLPLADMRAWLIYVPLEDNKDKMITPMEYYNHVGKTNKRGVIWTSKTITIRPEPFSSQLLWDAFQKNRGLISVAYTINALGVNKSNSGALLNPQDSILKTLELEDLITPDSLSISESTLITAGAIQIGFDLNKWPELLKMISFTSELSPKYGLVDVYCYDFNNGFNTNLAGKIIEFEAKSPGRGTVRLQVEFWRNAPEIYAHNIKFDYAVRLDSPLNYRVTEITSDGDLNVGVWQQKDNWHGIIDITSQDEIENKM